MSAKPMPFLALVCFLVLGLPAQSAEAPDTRRSAVEQKLKLVGHVLAGPKAKQAAAGDSAEARAQIAKAQQLMESAKSALAQGDLDQAGAALDQALKAISAASSQSPTLDVAAQRARQAELNEQVQTYRSALVDVRKDPQNAAGAAGALEKLDKMTAEAGKLAAANKYAEANKLLADAYQYAATSLTSLRAGQTVTLSLKFDTPADEYAYEQKVNHSHEMLVEMMLAEGRASGAPVDAANRILDDNRKAKVEADKQAKSGKHPEAIKTLEGATHQLKRALQSFGMPIF